MPVKYDYDPVREFTITLQSLGFSKPVAKRIIYSGNKTVVLWEDGTKTIVACSEGETYDEFDGFTAALAKKIYGSTCAVKREIRKKSTNQNKKQEVAENN